MWQDFVISINDGSRSEAKLHTEKQKREDASFYSLWSQNMGNLFSKSDANNDQKLQESEAITFLS